MNNYLGISIGPISATLSQARKTRELWLGSYFFSHVMKLILEHVQQYGTIIAQDISKLKDDEKLHGAGIYSDRCYVKLDKEFGKEQYDKLVESVLNTILVEDKEALKEYLQIYCTVQDVEKNPILVLNHHLNAMELQTQYYPENIYALSSGYDERKKLSYNGERVILPTTINGLIQEWYEEAFDKNDRNDLIKYFINNKIIYSFPSLLEISTKGLERRFPELYSEDIHPEFEKELEEEMENKEIKQTSDTTILEKIKETFNKDFQTAHKYLAIVSADADNMGKLLLKIDEKDKNEKLLDDFSKYAAKFSRKASQVIYEYGGKPVYIGGDDLLFFAPVVSHSRNSSECWFQNNTHIFRLIEKLDQEFNEIWTPWFEKHPELKNKTTLSYGISMTYYKYPLNEANDLSGILLKRAKEIQGKNRIAVQVMTHSGSFDEVILDKFGENSSFKQLLYLLEIFHENPDKKEDVINSVLQRLRTDTTLLLAIGEDKDSFRPYFTNEYDLETAGETKEFIVHSISLFDEIFSKHDSKEKALNELCTLYRLLNFLIHKEK